MFVILSIINIQNRIRTKKNSGININTYHSNMGIPYRTKRLFSEDPYI